MLVAMDASSPPRTSLSTSIEVEWNSDNSSQIRLAAWHIQRVRRSKQFFTHRARQLVGLYALMLVALAGLSFRFSTPEGTFSIGTLVRNLLVASSVLVVFALFHILRGGKVSTPAALRMAANLNKAGALSDTSGRWWFRLNDAEATWEWLDRGMRVSWPVDRLDPPAEFDGTLMFSSLGMAIGLVPMSTLTPEQHERLLNLARNR
jgi:hypothetical protein